MIKPGRLATIVALGSTVAFATADAAGLNGSLSSMRKQNEVARSQELTFLRTPAQVRAAVAEGKLDTVAGNADYRVNSVSFPYAQPEVLKFIEQLAAKYSTAFNEKLVVTSLTRPTVLQPRNAHQLSVHPAGMAVDFRVPTNAVARTWLEAELLDLEREGVIDVTRERRPPHYHVAVFPDAYREYAERNAPAAVQVAQAPVEPQPVAVDPAPAVPAAVTEADAGAGFGNLAAFALFGAGLVAGAAGRKRIPALGRAARR